MYKYVVKRYDNFNPTLFPNNDELLSTDEILCGDIIEIYAELYIVASVKHNSYNIDTQIYVNKDDNKYKQERRKITHILYSDDGSTWISDTLENPPKVLILPLAMSALHDRTFLKTQRVHEYSNAYIGLKLRASKGGCIENENM